VACMQVRDAGKEAWLGREAPPDPLLDLEPDEAPPLLLMPPPPPAAVSSVGDQDAQELDEHSTDGGSEHALVAGVRSKTGKVCNTCLPRKRTGFLCFMSSAAGPQLPVAACGGRSRARRRRHHAQEGHPQRPGVGITSHMSRAPSPLQCCRPAWNLAICELPSRAQL
jgi:hypothetical protein